MNTSKLLLLAVLCATPALLIFGAETFKRPPNADPVARGRYLVTYGGCNDCHTPLKLSATGPVPDMTRMLSGHPQDTKLPFPSLKPGAWFVVTAGMTAWAGPWGITYSANLTPDTNTGLGIWTEGMFVRAMRTGRHMGAGREILPPMPWRSIAALHDGDLKAIYAYLRTIPAITNRVPAPVSPDGNASVE